MTKSIQEDMYRLYANIPEFHIGDLNIHDFDILWGPGTNPLHILGNDYAYLLLSVVSKFGYMLV